MKNHKTDLIHLKSIALVISLFMSIILSSSVFAYESQSLRANVLKYDPMPAEQGNLMDVWVQLSNPGGTVKDVSIELRPEYPFSLPDSQQLLYDIGTIASTENKVVKFTVMIAPDAPNTERNISFRYQHTMKNRWIYLKYPITIQTQNAGLVIENYSVSPSVIIPGQRTALQLRLKNIGKIAVKNVDVVLGLEGTKFSATGSGTKKRIEYIGPGGIEKTEYELASDTSTEVKVYNLPVNLNYQDERNKKFNDSAQISIPVNAAPDLAITVDSTNFEKRTIPGKVTLKIINKGIVNLKYVNLGLAESPDYIILSPSDEVYVGNLDSDDFETAEFTIKPLVERPKLKLSVAFKDPYNRDFSQKFDIPLRIITADDLVEKSSREWIPWTIGVGVIVIGFLFMRRRKK